MRTLTLFTTTLVAVLGLSLAAQAATLTMSTDKSTYAFGETIVLTVIGDPQGGTTTGIFGTISYNPGLVSADGGQTQNTLTSFGGFLPWTPGALFVDNPTPNTQDSFNQLAGVNPQPADQLLTAVMSFTVGAVAGTANFGWIVGGGTGLSFFGLSTSPGTSVTIIPEPTTASLLGLGLLGLTVAGRRRR